MNISKIITFISVILAGIGGTYYYEKGQSTSDYFDYYGHVTIYEEFHFPERLRSYTFGKSHVGPLTMDFVNILWCRPLNAPPSEPYKILVSRQKIFQSFKFDNILPEEIADAVGKPSVQGQSIGKIDEDKIRANGEQYVSWNMGEIRPYHDSNCYIDTEVTTYTTIFGIPKSIRFSSKSFDYYTTLRAVVETVNPYDIWMKREDSNIGIVQEVTID